MVDSVQSAGYDLNQSGMSVTNRPEKMLSNVLAHSAWRPQAKFKPERSTNAEDQSEDIRANNLSAMLNLNRFVASSC